MFLTGLYTGKYPFRSLSVESLYKRVLDNRIGARHVVQQIRFFDAHSQQALDLVLIGHCCLEEN